LYTASVQAGAANPFDRQVEQQLERLGAPASTVRARAAESLGYLRAFRAAPNLVKVLSDETPAVRREAALSLGWCGGRAEVAALLAALDDSEWTVRQAAWVALTNLTGMEFPFDAQAKADARGEQARRWREWWQQAPADRAPDDVFALLKDHKVNSDNWARGCAVTVSTEYKGPPETLTDGATHTGFWQTKNVPFPQHCTIDLGEPRAVRYVVVHQYGPGFCMTDYAVSLSDDGKTFREALRKQEATQPLLTIEFSERQARYVRVISYASERPVYPTTFREVEVPAKLAKPAARETVGASPWRTERGLRALGALGGQGAAETVLAIVKPYVKTGTADTSELALIQSGLRSLGRLRDLQALPLLVSFLENPVLARFAADALGDFGDPQAAQALIAAYPRYARTLEGKEPALVPADDKPGFESADRMYETPFAIASALARLPLDAPDDVQALRAIVPLLLTNLPSDYDGAMLYESEAGQVVTAHLVERAGLLPAARNAALAALSIAVVVPDVPEREQIVRAAQRKHGGIPHAAAFLPALCRDPNDTPALLQLLTHADGWVKIDAAKALMFMKATQAVEPLAKLLADAKPEAAYGWNGEFMFERKPEGQDECNDPPPRWREAFTRALGRLGATQHVPLLAKLLRDEGNALEIQTAAAHALDEVGTPEALDVLRRCGDHPFHSVRLIAREALWRRQLPLPEETVVNAAPPTRPAAANGTEMEAVVFIKGPNRMPNRFQIDPWRQTYSTTDSGPTYRLGRNLFVLRPATPNGSVKPLTEFADGWVADCEVSWDGRRVVFARRGGNDPWWHVWEINADGSGLRQLTNGPYHDVQPAYLGDGRIVFSTSRIGMRDEYHGYPATGLAVMNGDGSDIHCVGFNLGRDDEPAVLPDGRIVFGRLELFYSRLKTERTIHAVFTDGTQDVTLYGPERREFWREVTRKSGENWWGEAPPRHRVLRMTQPQPYAGGRILCATTGGLTLVGPERTEDSFLPHDRKYAVTTPFPLNDGRVLCAAVEKRPKDTEGNLALCTLDASGALTVLHHDPAHASFEPRPLMARQAPVVLPEFVQREKPAFTARLLCGSVVDTQLPDVALRGKLVRVIEGQPIVGRHFTHLSQGGQAWKNHVGTLARVLGTVPLAADGSFYLEVPADRLIHLQVLDSDRLTVGNQQIWMYARPKETRSCVGCHERPETTPRSAAGLVSRAARATPVQTLPTGGEFLYRAKVWQKGVLNDQSEEQTRTVRAVNLLGRR
jgi:HEAT repeat protein